MKRILTSLLLAFGIAGPFAAHLAAETNTAVADIPFAFVVSNRALPAGRYAVSQLNTGSPVFSIRDAKGYGTIAQLGKNESGQPENPSLTFACYGKQCVLAKVTPPFGLTAYALSQKAIEKNLTHKLGMASMIAVRLTAR